MTGEFPFHDTCMLPMQVAPRFAVGTLRLSTGRQTTEEEVDEAVKLIVAAAKKQGMELAECN